MSEKNYSYTIEKENSWKEAATTRLMWRGLAVANGLEPSLASSASTDSHLLSAHDLTSS